MPLDQSMNTTTPYVRPATLDDLDEFVKAANRAFLHDPVFNYFANLKQFVDPEVDAEEYRGHVTVVVDPANNGRIVGGALWMPPRKRMAAWKLHLLFKSGFGKVLKQWGLGGLSKMVIGYQSVSEKKMKKCFEEKGVQESPKEAWYVQLIFTDPDYQGRGLMSKLMRDAFAKAPEATFCLEASTAKSRDLYAHLGFENPIPIPVGVGLCNSSGLRATGKDAAGVEAYAMGRWPSKR
ncbi:hypothetical protein NLJ89_g5760 [Agrocybe chaxingu]|uniref:N-acetyltransferase domain-containing protein n=1 Tax=Agrocybe chaxingu TaxID=84603 RepID=A0A9W8JXW2_9AGAR|nr:hypothetical protein NLJ89_g5760 [Agrocybe chaxingu]